MSTIVTIADETLAGTALHEFALEFLTERVTVREIIRARIYQEVTEHNARKAIEFRGLVQPQGAEQLVNRSTTLSHRTIDWEVQFQRALEGFKTNRFLILVDDRQVDDLDEEIELRYDSRVSFLKLVPLVGG